MPDDAIVVVAVAAATFPLFFRLFSLASRSLVRRLLRKREALRFSPAFCACLSVVSAFAVSHKLTFARFSS
jgi:hypothetical protein